MGWWEDNFGVADPTINASYTTPQIDSTNVNWNKEYGNSPVSFAPPTAQIGMTGPVVVGQGSNPGSVPVGGVGSAIGVPGGPPVVPLTNQGGGAPLTLETLLGQAKQKELEAQKQAQAREAEFQKIIDSLTGQTQGLTGQLSTQNQQFQALVDKLIGQQSTLTQQSQAQQDQFNQMFSQLTGQQSTLTQQSQAQKDQFSQMLGQLTGQIGNVTTQFNQQTEQLRTQFNTQLGTLLSELSQAPALQMPDIDKMFAETLSTKQKAVEAQKADALDRFNREVIPQVRNQLASSGFLNSDQRFALENEARQSLEKTYASIEAQAQADALQEALQKAGLQANVAQTIVDAGLRQKALLLQAQGQLEQQAYQTGSLGMQGMGTALNALLGQGQLDVSRAGQGTQSLGTALDALLGQGQLDVSRANQGTQSLGTALDALLGLGNLGVAQGNLAVNQGNLGLQKDIYGQEYGPSGLKQQGMNLQNKTLQSNTQNQQINNFLQAAGLAGIVPQSDFASMLGLTPGTKTFASQNAEATRAFEKELADINNAAAMSRAQVGASGSGQSVSMMKFLQDMNDTQRAESLAFMDRLDSLYLNKGDFLGAKNYLDSRFKAGAIDEKMYNNLYGVIISREGAVNKGRGNSGAGGTKSVEESVLTPLVDKVFTSDTPPTQGKGLFGYPSPLPFYDMLSSLWK